MNLDSPTLPHARAAKAPADARRETHALAQRAFTRLEDAGLDEVAEVLRRRVFSRPTSLVFEMGTGSGMARLQFKPMVELLLRHLAEIAEHRGHSGARECHEAVDLAGF